MRVMEAICRWQARPRDEQLLLLRACALLRLATVAPRLVSFRRLATWAGVPHGEARKVTVAQVARARSYAACLERAARYQVSAAHCLQRSLALHWWLRLEGLPSELRIGVRKDGGELRAHAWVELAGTVVNDGPDDVRAFTPLNSPAEASTTAGGTAPRAMALPWRAHPMTAGEQQ